MYHSITFGNKNTWDDWHLVPETQPLVALPAQKTNYIDVPGASGSLDMSEALTGYPIYSNRTGSFNFIVTNNAGVTQPYHNHKRIHQVVEDIADYLHGRRMQMILEDDPNYYYEGRFEIEGGIEESFNKVTINYNLDPYKWSIFNSADSNWEWDPFNFETGVIYRGLLGNIELVNSAYIEVPARVIGVAPIQPTFYIEKNSSSNYWYVNINVDGDSRLHQSGNINKGYASESFKFDDFVIAGKAFTISAYCSGSGGRMSVNFRPGRL